MNANLIMILVVLGAFWLLVIRPQQQRQKKHAEMVASLAPGSEIVTIGGIYATVVTVGERLRVRVIDGSEFEISPQAVGRVLPATEVAPEEEDASATAEADETGHEPGA